MNNNSHSPAEKEIELAVINMYEKLGEAVGAGGCIIKDVKVLKIWEGNDKLHYNARVTVKGLRTSPPLAIRRPDEEIDETRELSLLWRDGGWVCFDD